MNPNDYYQLLMNATKNNKATNHYSDALLREKQEKYKSVAKRYDQYRDETGSIHVGDSIFEDNEDGTFTDSSGKSLSIKDMNEKIRRADEDKANKAKEKEDGGVIGGVGDFFQGLGAGVVKGAEGVIGSGARAVDSLFVGDGENAVTKWADKAQKDTDKWTKEHADSTAGSVGNFIGDLPGGIVSGVADAGSTVVRGMEAAPEGIAADIAGFSSDPNVRKAAIDKQKELADRISGGETDDIVKAGTGAVLADAETIVNLMTAGKGGAVFDGGKALITNLGKKGAFDAVKQAAKDSGKEVSDSAIKNFIKTSSKSGTENAALNTPIQVAQQVNDTGKTSAGDVAMDVVTNAAFGIAGGRTGRSELNARAARDAEVAVKARDERVAKVRKEMEDDYLNKQKAADQFAADSQGTGQAQLPEGNRVKMLMATNPRDDVPATTLADGSQIVTGSKFQRSNVNRIKEIDKQLQQFNSGESKLSGEQAKALSDERKAVINEINSEVDTRTNTGATLDEVNSQLDEISKGFVPDEAKKPIPQIEDAGGIIGRDFFDNDMRTAALEIVQDANQVTEVLDSLMTPQRFSKMADDLDAQYNKDIERIDKMPARRQEMELEKVNKEYEDNLNKLANERDDAAPAVQEYTNMLAFLKQKEDRLTTLANTMVAENPGKALEVDETRLNGKVDQLTQQKKIAEVTEGLPPNSRATVGSVTNGVRPSENTNPRVVEAVDNDRASYTNLNSGKDPGVGEYVSSPSRNLRRMGGLGEQIDNILSEATDTAYIRDQISALQVQQWYKRAGKSKGMEQVARSLDGDMDAFSKLNDEQKVVLSEIRDMFKQYADELGLPENARIKDYLPHIMNGQTMDKVDFAVMRLATGRNMDGTTLTAKDIKEANTAIQGIDFQTLAMIKRNSRYKRTKNGFMEKRTGAEDYSFELRDIITAYTHAAHRTIHIDPAIEQIKPLTRGLSERQNEYVGKLVGHIKDMDTAKIDRTLNESLSKIPFLGSEAFSDASRVTRRLIYDALLGANPGSAIRNLSQGANTYAKLGNKYTAHGMKMAAASFNKSQGGFDELLRNGVLMNRFSDLRDGGKMSSARSAGDRALWTMFSSVEQFNRATAYFGAKQRYIDKFVKAAEKKGQKIDINNLPEDVLKNAEHAGRQMSKNTQFEFGVMDVPLGQTSNFAKNAIQFQSFNISQVKFLKEMIVGDTDSLFAKQPDGKYKLSGEGAAQIARYVGAQAVFIGTVGSLIGMSLEDMVPYYGDVTSVFDENKSPTGAVPISPITKLLIGDHRGGKGALQVGSEAISAVAGNESARKNIAGDTIEYGKDLASSLLPGGAQARKTIEGLASTEDGVSTNASGKVRFVQDQDFSSKLRAGMFGQYQTDAGREWVKDGFPTFSEKQSGVIQEQETLNDKERYADMYKITQGRQGAVDKIKEAYSSKGQNAAFRKAQEWNDKQDKLIAEYRQKHQGALPKEIADGLNKSKITYKNLRMNDD